MMAVAIRVMFPAMLLLLSNAAASAAQVTQQSGSSTAESAASPPLEAVSRDPQGRLVVRAFRIAEPIRLDGRLDESTYRSLPAIGGFLQSVPKEGAPASERTEAWVLYDDDHVYVAARCWDSAPPERWVANELRRDTNQLRQNDTFGVLFDTFHDRRSGFAFYTNAIGAIADYAIVDEGIPNTDWNPVWSVRTGRFDGGWTVEMAIPFKSLRYRPDATQNWGIQFRRAIRRKNEWTYLTPVPAAMGGPQGLNRVSLGATLIGLEPPSASKNVEIKPYVISRLTTDRLRVPPLDNDPSGNAGVDAKFGLTANLTADLTYNTDFAQVEIDEQQVNLTRFSLFFPEKREFFLESRGLFDFGRGGAFGFGSGIPGIAAGGGGSGGFASLGGGIVPSLFYSRRIGLNRNRVIPIDLGARLTGKAGPFGIGLLNIQTDDEVTSATPATNFTVMRIKRDILRRSSIGAMFTNRSRSNLADGSNQAFGIDGVFSFRQDIALGGYYARTRTPGLDGKDTSYQARFEYGADRYGARLDHLYVGDHFNPEVGFVQRDNFRRSFASARFSPRPASIRRVRKFNWEGSLEYILDGSGMLETRVQTARFGTEFESSDLFNVEVRRDYERLVRP
ncbi:MAG: carbohydrate binding family 9 domain-containing protein, partial [Acidobacteria bacterium]|nr:carbohydrate binding family 9 domain-containing protein [Acidobacteriota bacterium]